MFDLDGGRPALPMLETGSGPQTVGRPATRQPVAGTNGGKRTPGTQYPLVLRNWRMRWRLVALVAIPTVAAIVLGGVRIEAARSTASEFAQVDQLAVLGGDITALVNAVEDERDITAGYVAANQAGVSGEATSLLTALNSQYGVTNARLAAVQEQAKQIGPGFPAVARTDLAFALSQVVALPELRNLAHSQISALPMITSYSGVVSTLLAFDNDIAAGSSSPQLAQTVSSLGALAQMEEQASQQRAILFATLLQGQFGLSGLQALTTAESNEASDEATFQTTAANLSAYVPASGGTPAGLSATLTEEEQFNDIVAGPAVDEAQSIEEDAVINGDNGTSPDVGNTGQTWFSDMSSTLSDIRQVEGDELASVVNQADSLHSDAENSEALTGVVVIALLLLVLLITFVMARSVVLPLRKLRQDALDIAGRRLPEMVRRLSEGQGTDESIEIEPIGIDSTDEIGAVARAFDQVHREAVRLAGDEAMLRANLNAMFVNLSRRSQSLIERQLGIIDSLEQSEQDPDRLSSLFRLDHLATRMRRNSENLLVLAGHEAPRKWSQPVPLVDVLRAAVSEIEQYERISLDVQPGVVVAGRVASDVVHLVAELAENATTFSPGETQVLLAAQRVPTGGTLIEITDTGLGINDQDLAYANWRLENPPVVDVAVSRRMGLFVVGRLAVRHGIKVRLQHATGGGLSALIWLPDAVADSHATPPLSGLRRRLDGDMYGNGVTAGTGPQPVTSHRRTGSFFQVPEPAWSSSSSVQPMTVPQPLTVSQSLPGRQSASARQPVPSAVAVDSRLPIFDSVESDWFRRSGKQFGSSQAADDGFRAAESVVSPATGDTTPAGLPQRVPRANLVPGSADSAQPDQTGQPESFAPKVTASTRSAEEIRSRLASFQRGGREGRGPGGRGPGGLTGRQT
ncbi:MAG: nitrate- and nitrite sensing domain-containing protein [Streptosporangiaceae bacterium]|jgi:signal transduction histidine kinase